MWLAYHNFVGWNVSLVFYAMWFSKKKNSGLTRAYYTAYHACAMCMNDTVDVLCVSMLWYTCMCYASQLRWHEKTVHTFQFPHFLWISSHPYFVWYSVHLNYSCTRDCVIVKKLRVAFATEYSFIWSTLWCYFSSLVLFSMASISLNVRTYHAELNIYHLCHMNKNWMIDNLF